LIGYTYEDLASLVHCGAARSRAGDQHLDQQALSIVGPRLTKELPISPIQYSNILGAPGSDGVVLSVLDFPRIW
jgi:hypothetical protein